MKLFTVFLLAMTAWIHCFGEAGPENTFLTIQNGKISGQTSIVKTELQDDTLAVEFLAEPTGKGTYDFDIPAGAKKIRLFGFPVTTGLLSPCWMVVYSAQDRQPTERELHVGEVRIFKKLSPHWYYLHLR